MLTPKDDTALVVQSESAGDSLAERIWNFRWDHYFPKDLVNGIAVERSNFDEFVAFAGQHFESIYGKGLRGPFQSGSSVHKKRFYESSGDFLRLNRGNETVGVIVTNALDWTTYYLRNIAILPSEQGSGLFQSFITYFLSCLEKVGIGRVEVDISPSNLTNQHVFNKLGFRVIGTVLDERWGALTRSVLHFDQGAEQTFLDQFCGGVESQLTSRPRRMRDN